MATSQHVRLLSYLAYLSVLFGVMLWAYVRLTAFDGLLRLEPGTSERVAFLPAASAGLGLLSRQALPAEVIPFHMASTARHLSPDTEYVPRELPFTLSLEKPASQEAVPMREELVEVGTTATHPIEPGQSLSLGGRQVRVLGMGAWRGLAPSSRGTRCASLALTSGDAAPAEMLLIEAERWVVMDASLAVGLRWHDSEEEARAAAAAQQRPGLEAAWFTVREGKGGIRSSSFTPGSGSDSADGSSWTVEGVEAGGGALRVRMETGGVARVLRVPANAPAAGERVRFEHPGAAASLVVLHAWREDVAVAAVLGPGEEQGLRTLELGIGRGVELGAGRALWLAQLLPYAVPVNSDDAEIRQVSLAVDGGERYFLREGGTASIGDVAVSYRRVPMEEERPVELRVRWVGEGTEGRTSPALRAPPSKGEKEGDLRSGEVAGSGDPATTNAGEVAGSGELAAARVVLGAGETARLGGWRLSWAALGVGAGDGKGVYLRVWYAPFSGARGVGIMMFVVGAYGLVLLRFWPRRG